MSFEKIRLKILKSQRGQGRGGGLGGLRSGGTVWIAPKGHRSLAKVVERRVSHRPLAPLGQPHPSHLLGAELRFLQFSLWPLHRRWGSETPAATADLTLLLLWVPPFAFLILGAGTSWPPALMGSQVRSQAPPRPLPHGPALPSSPPLTTQPAHFSASTLGIPLPQLPLLALAIRFIRATSSRKPSLLSVAGLEPFLRAWRSTMTAPVYGSI